MCLASFFLCYALVLLCLWPLLIAQPENIPDETPQEYIHNLHVPVSLKEAHVPGQEKLGKVAGEIKKRVNQLRQGRGVTDSQLLEQTKREFDIRRNEHQDREKGVESENAIVGHAPDNQRSGFMVVGMHRSGTSMLSGLLVSGCGYEVGKNRELIGASFDNEKGFFERVRMNRLCFRVVIWTFKFLISLPCLFQVDVVLQNDEFFYNQNMAWEHNVINYDYEKALKDKKDGGVTFKHGSTGLKWLNDPTNVPWLQKDPRMCITLKTWLKLMDNEPAIVFTYRHPLEVAKSLTNREKGFTVERGLRLWIVYNMRAIQNSKGLCIVKSRNTAVLENPLKETQRIADELTSKCGVVAPPRAITKEDVDKFVDPNLQHNKKLKEAKNQRVLHEYNNGDCKVLEYKSDLEDGIAKQREGQLYEWAMKIYCDLESGKAHEEDYEWPLG